MNYVINLVVALIALINSVILIRIKEMTFKNIKFHWMSLKMSHNLTYAVDWMIHHKIVVTTMKNARVIFGFIF